MGDLRRTAEAIAKYHAEHASYGGVSQEFHARAETFIRSTADALASEREARERAERERDALASDERMAVDLARKTPGARGDIDSAFTAALALEQALLREVQRTCRADEHFIAARDGQVNAESALAAAQAKVASLTEWKAGVEGALLISHSPRTGGHTEEAFSAHSSRYVESCAAAGAYADGADAVAAVVNRLKTQIRQQEEAQFIKAAQEDDEERAALHSRVVVLEAEVVRLRERLSRPVRATHMDDGGVRLEEDLGEIMQEGERLRAAESALSAAQAEVAAAQRERQTMDGLVVPDELTLVEGVRALRDRSARLAAEVASLRETNARLNRRAQQAEAAVAEKVQAHPTGSLGRALANLAAHTAERERDEAQAEVERLTQQLGQALEVINARNRLDEAEALGEPGPWQREAERLKARLDTESLAARSYLDIIRGVAEALGLEWGDGSCVDGLIERVADARKAGVEAQAEAERLRGEVEAVTALCDDLESAAWRLVHGVDEASEAADLLRAVLNRAPSEPPACGGTGEAEE